MQFAVKYIELIAYTQTIKTVCAFKERHMVKRNIPMAKR